MSTDDTVQIKVGKHTVGVLGLKSVMGAMAETYADQPDALVRSELLARLRKRNYFPDKAKEAYGDAFLREFKKFLGEPYEEEVVEGLTVKVLGPGCAKCKKTEELVKEAVAETGVDATVEKVSDMMQIAGYGVMATPAVVIDGEVKLVGKVPSKKEIISWIK